MIRHRNLKLFCAHFSSLSVILKLTSARGIQTEPQFKIYERLLPRMDVGKLLNWNKETKERKQEKRQLVIDFYANDFNMLIRKR